MRWNSTKIKIYWGKSMPVKGGNSNKGNIRNKKSVQWFLLSFKQNLGTIGMLGMSWVSLYIENYWGTKDKQGLAH